MTKRKHKRQRTESAAPTSKRHQRGRAARSFPWIFYWFFGFLVLFFPVFYLPHALDRTLAPRLLALSVLLLLSLPLLFNQHRLTRWDFSVLRKAIFLLFWAFFLLTVISAFFADNPMESYLFIMRNFLFASGLAMAAIILHNTPNWQERLPKLFIVAAGIAVIIGFVQYYQRVHLSALVSLADGRDLVYMVTGVFSHKNFFSSVLTLMLPFTLFGIHKYRNKWQLAAILSSAGILLMVFILRTRSVWVGMMAAGLVASLVLLFNAKRFKLTARWRLVILAGLMAGIAGVVVLFNLGDASDPFSAAGRIRSIFDPQSRHNVHRLFIWNASLDIIKEEPLTGVGAGNWLLHIPKHYKRNFEHLEAMGWRQPHNDYIWIAAEQGIFALMIYLAAFVLILYYLVKVIRNKGDDDETDKKVFALLLMAGVIACLADAFFSFPYERIDIMVFMMIIAAASVALFHATTQKKSFKPVKSAILFPGIFFMLFGVFYSHQSINMEKQMGLALRALEQRSWIDVLHHADAAKTPFRSLGPHLYPPEFLEGIAYQNQEQYRRAVASFEKAREQAPHDIRILHMLGNNYRRIEKFDEAYACFMELMNIYPPSPSILRDVKLLVVDLSDIKQYEPAYKLLVSIPNWEDDPEIVRNVNALEVLK